MPAKQRQPVAKSAVSSSDPATDQTVDQTAPETPQEAPQDVTDQQDGPEVPVDDSKAVAAKESPSTDGNGRKLDSWGDPEPEGRILEADEPLSLDGEEHGGYVIAKEAVYRRLYVANSRRWHYSLVIAKGAHIPKTTLQKQ